MRAPEFRLRTPSAGLLALPWDRPLSQWNVPDVPLRDIAVGPSRHLVKFVEADDALWAVKDMPQRIAAKEYDVLRRLEEMGLPAVRPAGLVAQPEFDTAILVTRYLEGSWQYRRLFMRLPPDQPKHRTRLLDGMAGLLVELHRHGVFWGDCSLANTLFSRDGQTLQAWLVDAETSEVHPTLSRGQREYDLDIMVENVAMGMTDLAERLGRSALEDVLIAEVDQTRARYDTLWDALHAEPVFGFTDRYRVEGTVRKLNELGFAVDEVSLQPVGDDPGQLKLHVAVGDRRYHAQRLQELARARNVAITLGSEGLLLHALQDGEYQTDRLPALNTAPKDVAGAGDCFFICSSLALCAGVNIWQSAYLGALAAACQVARVGNVPLSAEDILSEIEYAKD